MKSFKKGLIWIKQHPLEVFLLVVILGLASFARLYRISEYMTFLGDEGRDVLVVKRMIVDGKLTLLGPTASVGGFFLGPVYYYLMAPFLFLYGLDPVGPAVMVGLFGVATVFLVYKTGRDFFDSQVGLVAAFFYAISPLIITYSRASWNPNLMPFFSLLIIYLLRRAVVEKKYYLLGVVGFLFGITFQLHYLAVFYWQSFWFTCFYLPVLESFVDLLLRVYFWPLLVLFWAYHLFWPLKSDTIFLIREAFIVLYFLARKPVWP